MIKECDYIMVDSDAAKPYTSEIQLDNSLYRLYYN